MLAIIVLSIIVTVSLAYNYHIKSLTFGKGWNGEVKAKLKDGRTVALKEAGADFESFFLPGATKINASIFLTRFVVDKNNLWRADDYNLSSYLQEEILGDGVEIKVIDRNRSKAVGYWIKIESQYPFKGSEPRPKYIFTDMQWYVARHSVAIK